MSQNKISSGSSDALMEFGIQLLIKAPFWGQILSGIIKQWNPSIQRMQLQVSTDGRITLWINAVYWESGLKGSTSLATFDLRFVAIQHQLLHLIFKHPLLYSSYSNPKIFHLAADLALQSFLPSTDQWLDLTSFTETPLLAPQTLDDYYQQLVLQDKDLPFNTNQLDDFFEEHQLWHTSVSESTTDQQIMHENINRLIQHSFNQLNDTAKSNIPSSIFQQIQAVQNQNHRSIPWPKLLHSFSHSSRRTQLKNSHRRPSRRYGTHPGLRIQNQQKLLLAIDTSGSITTNALNRIFKEIHQIWRRGAEIHLLECDDQIRSQSIYTGNIPSLVKGGGNTLFDPPIAYANAHHNIDALVYFTDGQAPPPQLDCRCPLLWIIVPNGIQEGSLEWQQLKGRKLKMDKIV